MRPVFTYSQQASETPQPGIKPQSQANSEQSSVSPPTSNYDVGVKTILPSTFQQQTTSNNPNTSKDNSPNITETSSIKKVVKVGSIFTKPNSNKPTTSTNPSSSFSINGDNSSENVIIDRYTLLTAWRELSKDKSIFDNASLMRIGSVEPLFIDENTFELAVANQNAESFFKDNQNKIIKALSTHLHNKIMKMTIRTINASDQQKILSPLEQVKEMISQNPAFGKLNDNLGLSL